MKHLHIILFVLAALVMTCYCQKNHIEKMRSKFKFNKYRINTMVKRANLTANVTAAIRAVDLSGLSLKELANDIPKHVYPKLGLPYILTITKPNLDSLMRLGTIEAPNLLVQIQNTLAANVTDSEAITSFGRDFRNNEPKSRTQILRHRLGKPMTWDKAKIVEMKDILFYFSIPELMKIENEEVIEEIMKEVTYCIEGSSSKSASCPSYQEMIGQTDNKKSRKAIGLRTWLLIKKYDEPYEWDIDDFRDMELTEMPLPLLMQVREDVMLSRKADVVTAITGTSGITGTKKREMFGREMVEILLEAEDVKEMTRVPDIKEFSSSLKGLNLFLYESDLPTVALDDITLKNMLMANERTALIDGTLPAEAATEILKTCNKLDKFTATKARELGMCRLSTYPAAMLRRTVQDMEITKTEMKQLTDCIVSSSGSTMEGKLSLLSRLIQDKSGSGSSLDIFRIPKRMMNKLKKSTLAKMHNSNLIKAMNKQPDFTPAQTDQILKKLSNNELLDMIPNARASLSSSQARKISKNIGTLKKMVKGLPATSAVGMIAAEKMVREPEFMPFMGAAEARKIDNSKIEEFLKTMSENFKQPTKEACNVLKETYVNKMKENYDIMIDNKYDLEMYVLEMLLPTDLEVLPPCVITAFGDNKIVEMSDAMKEILYYQVLALGSETVLSSNGISWFTLEKIFNEAYIAMDKPRRIVSSDVEDAAELLIFAPPSDIRGVTDDAVQAMLEKFNNLAMTPLMPCLHPATKDAITEAITKLLGKQPEEWSNLRSVHCLLYMLPEKYIWRIPEGGLVNSVCEPVDKERFKSMEESKEAICNRMRGNEYNNEKMAKKRLDEIRESASLVLSDPNARGCSSRRSKRATMDINICDRAAINGVADISNSELEAILTADIEMCLEALGSKKMDNDKAQILSKRVKSTLDPVTFSTISAEKLKNMGYITKGMTPDEIGTLPRLEVEDYDDAVELFGNPDMMYSSTQRMAFAKKVKETWKQGSMDNWKSADIIRANRLLCELDEADLDKLKFDELKDSVKVIGTSLEGCDMKKTMAPLAKKLINSYDPLSTLTKSDAREMQLLMSAISPETIKQLPSEAFAGMTPGAMKALPLSAVKMMTASQITNLESVTAYAVSENQKAEFSAEMLAALNKAKVDNKGNSALNGAVYSILLASAAVLAILR